MDEKIQLYIRSWGFLGIVDEKIKGILLYAVVLEFLGIVDWYYQTPSLSPQREIVAFVLVVFLSGCWKSYMLLKLCDRHFQESTRVKPKMP